MKKWIFLICAVMLLTLCGCTASAPADIAATTLPVYTFTSALCEGTELTVTQLVTENVSCLHDYTLQVRQMQAVEGAQAVVISGAGLEDFLEDVLSSGQCVIDASQGLSLLEGAHHHDHGEHDHSHVHAEDPHIWLSPINSKAMAHNICHELSHQFPQYADIFAKNLETLEKQLDELLLYGQQQLSGLSCRELITFHDGFTYLAECFDLTILKAVEEESGSEASASELVELIGMVREHALPAVFTEVNGSTAAANIIASETGVKLYALDMAISSGDYFEAMYCNIDTLREALQ